MPFLAPPDWSNADLKAGRDQAERNFTEQRREEGPRSFQRMYEHLRPAVVGLFEASDDLRHLEARVFENDPDAWQVSRYITGPPISQEDLWTLVGGPKFNRVPAEYAGATADALSVVIDPVRFPWTAESRAPSAEERERAMRFSHREWRLDAFAEWPGRLGWRGNA